MCENPIHRLDTALEGRYRIERELGEGGMATVYLAEDLRHRRRVAIKVLRADLAQTLGPDRFTREIEIAAALTHPHILPLHDSGGANGLLYYVMPFVQGESLRDRLEKEGALPVSDATRIFREIVDALGAAHAHGVVHRDVKPANILLSGGHALVADFGVAKALSEATGTGKVTTAGVALGTPQYMAPEQASADSATDHRADLFAAGVIAYEMLTGVSPFAAPSTAGIFAALMTRVPEHPGRVREGVPEPLGDIVLWCLEKDPAARPQEAGELLGRLDTAVTPPGGSPPAGVIPGRRSRVFLTRGRMAAAMTFLVLASLGVWRAVDRQAEVRWARQEALPEVIRVLGENRTREAAELAFRVEGVLGADPVLEPLWPRMTTPFRAVTDPPGAAVWYRPYTSTNPAWVHLGTTPYETRRFPTGMYRFRVELDGYEPVGKARAFISAEWFALLERSGFDYLSDPSYVLDLTLTPSGGGPPGMLHVAGGPFLTVPVAGFGVVNPVDVPPFWIDRTEVTNAAYLEFVEAGAYSDSTMPDAVFEASRSLYTYDRSQPLAARVDSTLTSPTGATVQWVSVDAAYGGRLPMRLHIPTDGAPPYGAVIFFPAPDLLFSREIGEPQLSFLPRAGWVLVEPIFEGGFQRNDGRTLQRLQSPASRTELHSHWVQDLGRAIDYLEQRPDVDGAAVAYAGVSLGAGMAPALLPHEPRFRAAILYSGGFSPTSSQESLDRTASLAGRLRLPLLMLGGRNDFSSPVGHQEALFRAFGTPEEHKRFRVYDAAHWPLPMNEVIRETVDFLNRYAVPGSRTGAGSRP